MTRVEEPLTGARRGGRAADDERHRQDDVLRRTAVEENAGRGPTFPDDWLEDRGQRRVGGRRRGYVVKADDRQIARHGNAAPTRFDEEWQRLPIPQGEYRGRFRCPVEQDRRAGVFLVLGFQN